MKTLELLHYVDHTQLKAYALWTDIEKLCEEAIKYQTASVCIPLRVILHEFMKNTKIRLTSARLWDFRWVIP